MTDAERTAAHEAGHAAAATVLGLSVWLVDTTTRTERTPGGGLRVIYGETFHSGEIVTREDARKRMIVILAGQIEGAEDWDEVPSWPLNPNASTDEYNLDALVEWLELDARGYDEVRFEALRLTLDREYRMLYTAISGVLDYVPRIGLAVIDQIQQLVREHR